MSSKISKKENFRDKLRLSIEKKQLLRTSPIVLEQRVEKLQSTLKKASKKNKKQLREKLELLTEIQDKQDEILQPPEEFPQYND
jgi:hypothetical protein